MKRVLGIAFAFLALLPGQALAATSTPTSGGGGEQQVVVLFVCSARHGDLLYTFKGNMTIAYHPRAQLSVTTFTYRYDAIDDTFIENGKNNVVASFVRESGTKVFYDTLSEDNEAYGIEHAADPFVGQSPTPVFISVKAIFDVRGTTDPTCTDTTSVFT